MPNNWFPELQVSGNAFDRGFAHGCEFRHRIEKTIEYYRKLFALSEERLLGQANIYKDIISRFSSHYATEIEGIAEGARIEPLLIYALNSRSEILNNCNIPECTSALNTAESILCQNWDWSEPLEDLVILLRVERQDGHRMATLTEPGMLAKVGMNSAGLGVCLNILQARQYLRGLPVHILLRAILDCGSMSKVRSLVSANAPGKASHVLVADRAGNYLSAEFSADKHYLLEADDGLLWHSNHYLASEALNQAEAFPSTRERWHRAGQLIRDDKSPQGMWQLLQDQTEQEMSICRPYSPSATPGFGRVGTVFSLSMDLKKGTMRIRRGCDPANADYTISV